MIKEEVCYKMDTASTTMPEHKRRKINDTKQHQQEQKILEYLQNAQRQDNELEPEVYDLEWLSNLSKQLRLAVKQNSEVRIKFSNDPLKFMDSETKLHDLVKQISNITLADFPLYNDFIQSSKDCILQIITHPNSDIINQFISVFNDLIDSDDEQDQNALLDFIKKDGIVQFLQSYLSQLNGTDLGDNDIKITIMNIFNELTNYEDEELRKILLNFDSLIVFLIDEIRKIETIQEISYYHELIIDYLFKIASWDKIQFAERHGLIIEVLLIQLSHFITIIPEDGSNQENFIESSIGLISTLITTKNGRSNFLQNEGFELILIIMKNGSWGFKTFIEISNHLIESINDMNNVELSVSIIESNFFLNHVFKILKSTKNRDEIYQVLKMLVKLIIFLPFNSDQRVRLINKLITKDFKSLDVILKIESKYDQGVSKIDGDYSFNDDYIDKIENGLDILQQISIFKSWLLIENEKMKNDMIHMKHFNLDKLKNVLTGYKNELEFNIENTDNQDIKDEFFEYINMINELLANLYS